MPRVSIATGMELRRSDRIDPNSKARCVDRTSPAGSYFSGKIFTMFIGIEKTSKGPMVHHHRA